MIDYLQYVRDSNVILTGFENISKTTEFETYKRVFTETKGTTLLEDKIDDFIDEVAEGMEESYSYTLDNAIKSLEDKLEELKSLNQTKVMRNIGEFK